MLAGKCGEQIRKPIERRSRANETPAGPRRSGQSSQIIAARAGADPKIGNGRLY
jgi:hypothetical protein